MKSCRVCKIPLDREEILRGTCNRCEQSIASAIKKKIVQNSQENNKKCI